MTLYSPSTQKIAIASLDDVTLCVEAQYNPKELQFDKAVNWTPHQKAGNASDGLQLEFTGQSQPRSTSIDFLFDGVEENDSQSVIDNIDKLQRLAAVRDPQGTEDPLRRPHHCVLVWARHKSVPPLDDKLFSKPAFQCVIAQVTVKYQVFSPDGLPLRATTTLKLQEATRVTMARP